MSSRKAINLLRQAMQPTMVAEMGLQSLYPNGTSAKTADFTAEAGYVYLITKVTGCDVVLPAPTVGDRIKLVFGAITSNNHTVTSDAATTLYTGYALIGDTHNGDAAHHEVHAPDGTNDRVFTMNGTTSGVSGVVELTATSTSEWLIEADLFGKNNPVTPFS